MFRTSFVVSREEETLHLETKLKDIGSSPKHSKKPPKIICITGYGGGGHEATMNGVRTVMAEAGFKADFVDLPVAFLVETDDLNPLWRVYHVTGEQLYNWGLRQGALVAWLITWVTSYLQYWALHADEYLGQFLDALGLPYGDEASRLCCQIWTEQKPDLILNFTTGTSRFISNGLKRAGMLHIPVLVVISDFEGTGVHSWIQSKTDNVLCGTSLCRQQALQFGVPPNQVSHGPPLIARPYLHVVHTLLSHCRSLWCLHYSLVFPFFSLSHFTLTFKHAPPCTSVALFPVLNAAPFPSVILNWDASMKERTVSTSHLPTLSLFPYPPFLQVYQISGMILRPSFYDHVRGKATVVDRSAKVAELGLDPTKRTCLVFWGGVGNRKLMAASLALLNCKHQLNLILLCGHNKPLYNSMKQIKWPNKVIIEEYTPNVSFYMEISDMIVCKPGPGVTSEAALLGLPILVEWSPFTLPQEVIPICCFPARILFPPTPPMFRVVPYSYFCGSGRRVQVDHFARSGAVVYKIQADLGPSGQPVRHDGRVRTHSEASPGPHPRGGNDGRRH
mmetsp:Transcript_5212/g.16671  ORF Transcript_5212/g.16671 Transcript_5212/m.16671 type:complete len:561 (+) Transcript_5212:470-2152(+)